jgi:hypothetical protein
VAIATLMPTVLRLCINDFLIRMPGRTLGRGYFRFYGVRLAVPPTLLFAADASDRLCETADEVLYPSVLYPSLFALGLKPIRGLLIQNLAARAGSRQSFRSGHATSFREGTTSRTNPLLELAFRKKTTKLRIWPPLSGEATKGLNKAGSFPLGAGVIRGQMKPKLVPAPSVVTRPAMKETAN